MKLSDVVIMSLITVFGLGAVVGIAVPLLAEVDIANSSATYRAPTFQDAVVQHRIKSLQAMNYALHEAYIAGYGQAMIDYEIVASTQPAKVIDQEETEEDER